jgi:LytS/YehU family sensor histidine kinase
MTLGLWVAQYAYLTARSVIIQGPMLEQMAVRRILTCIVGAALCFGMDRALVRLRGRSFSAQAWWAVGLSVGASIIWSAANLAAMKIPPALYVSTGMENVREIGVNSLFMVWSFLSWSGVWLALAYNERLAERDLQLSQSQLAAADIQNQMLRYQLNPHFMFNTMSAITTLIAEKDLERAEQVVLNLCRFLRASLERAPQDKIMLREELGLEEQYLSIERVRFEDRLSIEVVTPPELEDCLVPGLILQPLVENAIKYGVGPSQGLVTVRVEARVVDDGLELSVRDNGGARRPRPNGHALGVGLQNVRRRLDAIYGDRAALRAEPRASGGFEAVMRLPLERVA